MTSFDLDQIDHLLSTTRAVRKRLDFDRPVPDDVLLRLIDLAEQTPSGSNQASRRWVVVRDPATKERIAQLYREAGSGVLTGLAAGEADERRRRVFDSAIHLAENLERVPALVIATIYGTHDGSGRPGLFDSVIQAAWNFCLAARARGIGTSWTTLHLQRAQEVAELLGIPDGVTQIVLLPVAYTTGGDFRPAPRRPAGEITFFDQWGFTTSTVPEQQRTHPGEGRGVSLDIDVHAPPEQLWPLVSDITLPSRFSSEAAGATWDENQQPGPGARFHGSNACDDAGHPAINQLMEGRLSWTTSCQVERWEPPHEFGYCVGDPESPSARWSFRLQPMLGGTTRVTHSMLVGPGESGTSIVARRNPEQLESIYEGRLRCIRTNIAATLAGIKALAEN
ncbi:nitroreductase family protein [Pseudonocardia sp. CA-142604]|uniref:nitroreductase family protein n=1 Tax=Pseudonocardia sp. CA-142604 TaxID=3240024 RepID=UPI003D8EC2BD